MICYLPATSISHLAELYKIDFKFPAKQSMKSHLFSHCRSYLIRIKQLKCKAAFFGEALQNDFPYQSLFHELWRSWICFDKFDKLTVWQARDEKVDSFLQKPVFCFLSDRNIYFPQTISKLCLQIHPLCFIRNRDFLALVFFLIFSRIFSSLVSYLFLRFLTNLTSRVSCVS